jgi:hypothetical protein
LLSSPHGSSYIEHKSPSPDKEDDTEVYIVLFSKNADDEIVRDLDGNLLGNFQGKC